MMGKKIHTKVEKTLGQDTERLIEKEKTFCMANPKNFRPGIYVISETFDICFSTVLTATNYLIDIR